MTAWWLLLALWPLSGWIGGIVTWLLEFDGLDWLTAVFIAAFGAIGGPILPVLWGCLYFAGKRRTPMTRRRDVDGNVWSGDTPMVLRGAALHAALNREYRDGCRDCRLGAVEMMSVFWNAVWLAALLAWRFWP